MSSFDDISKMFHTEHEKLTSLIDLTSQKSDLSLHEIVETYYQIMNMSSMITMLKQQLGSEHKSLLDKIIETDVLISEKFNGTIHPQILQNLTKSIKDTTTNLQSDTSEKSPEEIIMQSSMKNYEKK
jgi:hypothetical protein